MYLVARAIGYKITGYNTIGVIGKVTPIIVMLVISGLALLKKNKSFKSLLFMMLMALSCYLFTSSTVHPWYVAMLLMLGILTNYKFPLLWSFTIILSYATYSSNLLMSNYWFIFFEYSVVLLLFVYEVFINKKTSNRVEV